MQKTFEYAVGDSWLLLYDNVKTVYTVTGCSYREKDQKEIYLVDIDGQEKRELTKNKLHYLLFRYMFRKLKCGKYEKYDVQVITEEAVRKYYAFLRGQEDRRLESMRERLDGSKEYIAARGEVKALEIQISKAEFYAPDPFRIMELQTKLDAAKKKRDALLQKLGIAPTELKRHYHCAACKDTGFVGAAFCSCVKEHERDIEELQALTRR